MNYEEEIKKYFNEKEQLYFKLKQLDIKKQEIRELKKKYGNLQVPLVVTLSGTPRAGKTTCIDNLFEFFKKTDLETVCLEEPAGLIYQTLKNKSEKKELLKDRVGFVERQYEIGSEYINKNLNGNDIILCDRGILDTFIWYDMYYKLGMMDTKRYTEYLSKLKQKINYYNYFYVLYCETFESMKRDYISSLSIEPRTTMNNKNVERYNSSLLSILPNFNEKNNYTKLINTTLSDKMDSSIMIANEVLDKVKTMYLRRG